VELVRAVDNLFDLSKQLNSSEDISGKSDAPEQVDLLDVGVLEKSNVCYTSEQLLSWNLLSEPLCLYDTVGPVLEQLNHSSSEDDQQPAETINVPSVLENQFVPQVQAFCGGNCNEDLMCLPSFSFSLHTLGSSSFVC
jgi:hypothetical protein